MKNDLSIKSMSDADVYRSSSMKLVLLIPNSKSKNHSLAIKFASLTESYQVYVEEQLFTICYITLITLSSARDCEIASKIINVAQNWKGFSIVYKGRTLSGFHLSYQVLPCITDAIQSQSKSAHCSKMLRGNSYIKDYRYVDYKICNFDLLVPCKIASLGFFEPSLDVPINEQYQAHAVQMGVNWCPFFNADNIKVIETKPEKSDIRDNFYGISLNGATASISIDLSKFMGDDKKPT
ncbi:hypothetical protein LU604_10980 [Erwinia tracheiphila]|uniref:Uncharacterized protein n=1 Tax=Erwinia tracheiphila TaxID=65700 RepID=A0A345CRH3_9GAMM|nr:hypothetical protein [Erwinia tracheiphila]AXF76040.1 hypothetical protein AV903_08275 [Erwinia tracheiphila]UIA85298.1 hypothetical protein LU604_10980 [Erwinia tracheiphila]